MEGKGLLVLTAASSHMEPRGTGREERTGADVRSEQMKRSSSTQGLCCAAVARPAPRAQKELCHSAVLGTLAQPPRTPPEGWTPPVHPLQSVCTRPARCWLTGPGRGSLLAAEPPASVLTWCHRPTGTGWQPCHPSCRSVMAQQGSHLHTQPQGQLRARAGTCSVHWWQTTKSSRTEHALGKMQLLEVSGLL